MLSLGLQILSWGYGGVVSLRNLLYKKKVKKSFFYKKPIVIGVGNLSLGGTGKTPLVIYLVQLLAKEHVVAVLSRGYKRTSVDFKVVNGLASASTAGDEPYLLYKHFLGNPNVLITVCENRAKGVAKIMEYRPNVEVIILDDAFQHLSLTPHLNILLTTFHQPFFTDHLLPLGRLREPRKGASRADIIVVTKSPPNLSQSKIDVIKTAMQPYHSKALSIFFTHTVYHDPVAIGDCKTNQLPTVLLLVTGIADPLPLRIYLETNGHKVTHLAFQDHHWFNDVDILDIFNLFHKLNDPDKAIVTTEKDYVRLIDHHGIKLLSRLPIFYIPMEIRFSQEAQGDFEEKINQALLF
ncbi:MAG: tetraacyldisaccharide 4'-kinase [Candidatus Cardinium sp.]|uniref:tetraacyldisaccharide 4'-kinase n=1 Tax=Cardinium endosymbiont of Dermatophagoides farinae TaxID=2597823 RepID=UPI0016429C81|nr:tetraacyldisaccharide 4'-kinase [Cardinium endosymbiont of Dermatophagoides farinae]UWW96853.1 MAG: tetraacyldisaccharide 4'-kinase [Candidatus Cardinium sp.]